MNAKGSMKLSRATTLFEVLICFPFLHAITSLVPVSSVALVKDASFKSALWRLAPNQVGFSQVCLCPVLC
jgi:hypothetical protein